MVKLQSEFRNPKRSSDVYLFIEVRYDKIRALIV